jgi:mannose-6-phosphate isomerase-like protein (cupin superfamily)
MTQKKLVVHEDEGEVVPDICGTAVEMINTTTSGSTKVSFAKLIIDPKQRSSHHYHKETEEVYYILSGAGRVIIGDQTYDVIPGHAVLLPIGVSHEIINTVDQHLVFLCADGPLFNPEDVYEG